MIYNSFIHKINEYHIKIYIYYLDLEPLFFLKTQASYIFAQIQYIIFYENIIFCWIFSLHFGNNSWFLSLPTIHYLINFLSKMSKLKKSWYHYYYLNSNYQEFSIRYASRTQIHTKSQTNFSKQLIH